jgi:predicted lysophospholipase L1 biosynthesis ABC-type transport system permease subunit
VEEVVERIAIVRFIPPFTILAGAVMVASSVAGTRFRRMRQVVTLKTLGATRRRGSRLKSCARNKNCGFRLLADNLVDKKRILY